MLSHSGVSDSLQPQGLQPSRFLWAQDSPGKNTGVHCHVLLQGIFPTQELNLVLPPLQADSLPTELQEKPKKLYRIYLIDILIYLNRQLFSTILISCFYLSYFVYVFFFLLFPLNRFFHSFVYLLVFYFYFSSLLVCSL